MSDASVFSPRSEATRYLEQAFASEEQNEFEKALEECNAAIRTDPSLADAHNLRGVILEELGQKEEAVLAYREAVRIDSGFQEAKENLRDIETELRKDRLRSLQVVGKGFWIRAPAYIIDVLFAGGLNYAAGTLGGLALSTVLRIVFMSTGRKFYFDGESVLCLSLIDGLVLGVLYFVIFERLYGATLGKLVLGLRVIKESGELCDLRAAFIRALYRFVDGFFFAIPAYLSMKSLLCQRIGDKKAQTIVVGSKEPIIQRPRAWWWFPVAVALYFALAVTEAILRTSMALR